MKLYRIAHIILITLAFCACSFNTQDSDSPGFYYPSVELSAQSDNSCFVMEPRDSLPSDDIGLLVREYLSGPKDSNLYAPFSDSVKFISYFFTDNTLELVFSDDFSKLSPRDITISCTGLAATLFHLTETEELIIQCENAYLLGKTQLHFTPDAISWIDTVTTNIVSETEVAK